MTEHINNEAVQAIIKLAYQQMQPMTHQQMMQQPQQAQQPPQPAPKPTLGQRAATAYRLGSALEKGTARIRKDRSKMKAREQLGREFRRSRRGGGGLLRSAAKAKFKSHMGYRQRQKGGIVTSALEGLSAGADKAIAAAKDRTAEAMRKQGNAGVAMYVAGQGLEGMKKKKGLATRAADKLSAGYRRVARESARATKNRAAAKAELARSRQSGQRIPLAEKRRLMDTASGRGAGSTARNVAGRLGTEGLASVMTPGGKRRSSLQLAGRGLQAAGKGYSASKETSDKIRKMIDG